MLEYQISRSHDRYFTWNGRHICSSYNPVKEAENWLSQYEREILPIKTVVVLGLGCGYHVAKARRAFPGKRIVVVEARPEFVAPAEGLHGLDFHDIEVIVAETEAIFRSQSRLNKLISSSYIILPFYPVMNLDLNLYGTYRELLTGRTLGSLKFQTSKRRTRHLLEFDSSKGSGVVAKEQLLSVKHLDQLVQSESGMRQFHLIKALQELIS